MYKTKLQEFCHRRSWELPEYATAKTGLDHMPRFTATVTVNGELFHTPNHCKSSKEAQNTAARVAFEHFTAPPSSAPSAPLPDAPPLPVDAPPQTQPISMAVGPFPLPVSPFPSSLPTPPAGLLMTKYNTGAKPAEEQLLQENGDETSQCRIDSTVAIAPKDILHMYKNLLQQHAQKENIGFPVYSYEVEGPPHELRFKSKVSLNGKSYETLEYFSTLKEAEQTAAKMACEALSVDVTQEDKGLYKNLLQEWAQKKGLLCPSYKTVKTGLQHKLTFMSTVEIGSNTFQGVEAKTRKQAEMNAAEIAYHALMKGGPPMTSIKRSSMNTCPLADNGPQNIHPRATIEKHTVAKDEEDLLHAKRAKSSTGNVDAKAQLQSNPSSHYPKLENSTPAAQPFPDPTGDIKLPTEWKTVVFPHNLNWPIPGNATVMTYINDQWVAYNVASDQQPIPHNEAN